MNNKKEKKYKEVVTYTNHFPSGFEYENDKIYIVLPDENDEIKKTTLIGHLCPCGCEKPVIITCGCGVYDYWQYSLNKKNEITITPSIAAGIDCGSHYFIRDNEVLWHENISKEDVIKIREKRRN